MAANSHTSAAPRTSGAVKLGTSDLIKWLLVVVSCPCHLLILAGVLAGTGVGALLVQNLPLAMVLMSGVFMGSLVWVGRDLFRGGHSETTNAEPGACCARLGRRKGDDS